MGRSLGERRQVTVCNRPATGVAIALAAVIAAALPAQAAELRGTILDAASGKPIPARVYVQSKDGRWFFAKSTAKNGTVVEYRKQRGADGKSVEMHTTLSAHPFSVELPPGEYTITIERGKEYFTHREKLVLGKKPREKTFRLKRWINMARRGWYSGETHVHRTLKELPNAMLAEDLNVALPLTYWVTRGFKSPATSEKSSAGVVPAKLIRVDDTHVIWPRNTEYEIFSVNGKRHTLGAVFVLNHKSVLKMGAPPVSPIAAKARQEGAILELDKHNWPWSMALIPTMNVDLFELTNNHIWRTSFFFRNFGIAPPAYMRIEKKDGGMTEKGWIDFGFQNYYALLNCGFRMRPTAGTASGVHPVPLGFGRVYVHLPRGFSYEKWMAGLNAGRSFVTTGPMLFATFNNKPPGNTTASKKSLRCEIAGTIESARRIDRIEIISAGEVVRTIEPGNTKTKSGHFKSAFAAAIDMKSSSWLAVRCWEKQADGRWRFAHTAPAHFEIEGKPLRPRKVEVQYLIDCVKRELARSRNVLPAAAIAEYEKALKAYQQRMPR